MLKPRSLLMSSQSDLRKVHHAPFVFSKEISVRTVYPAPSPVPVVLLVSFLSNSLKSARVEDGPGLNVARGRDPSGIEGFGYVCEDQAAGPLRGSL